MFESLKFTYNEGSVGMIRTGDYLINVMVVLELKQNNDMVTWYSCSQGNF